MLKEPGRGAYGLQEVEFALREGHIATVLVISEWCRSEDLAFRRRIVHLLREVHYSQG